MLLLLLEDVAVLVEVNGLGEDDLHAMLLCPPSLSFRLAESSVLISESLSMRGDFEIAWFGES